MRTVDGNGAAATAATSPRGRRLRLAVPRALVDADVDRVAAELVQVLFERGAVRRQPRRGAQDAQRDVEAEEDQDKADAPHDDGHALEELLVEGRHGGREEQAEEREGQDQAEGRPNLHATAPALREQLQVEDESAARSRDEDVPLLVREVDVLAALEALLVRLHAAAQRTVRFSQHPWTSRAWP